MWAEDTVVFNKKKAELLATERNKEAHELFRARAEKKTPDKGSEKAEGKKIPERTAVKVVAISFENLVEFLEVLYRVAVWAEANKILEQDRAELCPVKPFPSRNASTCCNSCSALWKRSRIQLAIHLTCDSEQPVCPQTVARTAWKILAEAGHPLKYSQIFPLVVTIMYNEEAKYFDKILKKFTYKEKEKSSSAKNYGKFIKDRFDSAYTVLSPMYRILAEGQIAISLKKNHMLVKSLKEDACQKR